MMTWQHAWRNGIAPQLSTAGLEALRTALESNDPRLLQGACTMPPPLQCVQDWPCEAACPIGYCCAFEERTPRMIWEVEEHFARVCHDADKRLGEPAACRWFLNWWDNTPPEESRPALLAEVRRELFDREPDRPQVMRRVPRGSWRDKDTNGRWF
jgi:hypothetical protein